MKKKHKNKILIVLLIAALLILTYIFGGEIISPQTEKVSSDNQIHDVKSQNLLTDMQTSLGETLTQEADAEYLQEDEIINKPEENKDIQKSQSTENSNEREEEDAYSEPKLNSIPEENAAAEKEKIHYCTLSISCETILKNMPLLNSQKAEIIPQDGIIFAEQQVVFYEGESVFHLLLREMKKNKIHFEYTKTPIYNSAYVEGIANIYELDCGELSGWRYKINGSFPNYGCSRYLLKDGDKVEWVYTCDFGADIGNYIIDGGGQKDE